MRPKIHINFAMSIDGKIALGTGEQTRLSNELDMKRVHELRNSVDAILVGIGTVISDDPSLTVKEKYVKNPKNPVRVILDSKLRIPENAKVLDKSARTIIYTAVSKKKLLNAEIRTCGKNIVDLNCMLDDLYSLGIRTMLVEGGSRVIGSFLSSNLFDIITIFIAPYFIGPDAPSAATFKTAMKLEEMIKMNILSSSMLGNGILLEIVPDVNARDQ